MSDSNGHDTSHIFQSLAGNLIIAIGKGIVAFFTGSGAMLAETLHSFSDCGNQLLLLLGVHRARRPPDETHPLGYGRALYFWSFMVALLLFTGGGLFSIYEGVHKVLHPEPVQNVWLGFGILGFSLLVEGWATWGNVRALNARRGQIPFFDYLKETKDSDLIVVFGENAAAVLGLALAMASLGLAELTGDPHWDGVGSVGVGVVLVGVALFLAREVQSLLIGEAADPTLRRRVEQLVSEAEGVESLLRLIAVQQGPGEVLLAMKVRMMPGLSSREVALAINALERRIHVEQPQVRWSFVEPDLSDDPD